MDLILKYFPDLNERQIAQFKQLPKLYEEWNSQINVISRKDMDNFYERHVLHSLGIAKIISFKPGTEVLDVGTGGGFPGIPLAILFPDIRFHLVDSIGKKVKVVQAISESLGLDNVTASHERAEQAKGYYDFVVSRAVTRLNKFIPWVRGKISKNHFHELHNGILYLKGGDLNEELAEVKQKTTVFKLPDHFDESFFETKAVVHVAL